MAGGIARQGDILGMGGILLGPVSSDVTVNGRPVALQGCAYSPHPPCSPKSPMHCFGVVVGGGGKVTVNGQSPLTKGSTGTCGDSVKTASSDVIIK
jgi:uncharacterized Zn-binding protein involved in type VI secretion